MKSIKPVDTCAATDAELIRLSRQGDQRAFGLIVERYQSLVCSIAYNRSGNLALSEDLAQEAFILAWQKLDDLKDVSSFKSWICTIVRNLANRSLQRSGHNINRASHLDAVAEIAADSETPGERAVSMEQEAIVWQALSDLPDIFREPLILFYREEHSVTRVAEALELTEDAVKQRLARGRKLLRVHLAAVVESTLINSKPTKVFTGAVLLGLSGASTKSVTAASVVTVTTSVAKTAAGAGAGSGLSSLFLWPLLNLPLIAWLFKLSYDETRSKSERQLLNRIYLYAFYGLTIFSVFLFSSFWWQQYLKTPLLRAMIPAALMSVFLIPWVLYCRKMGKQIEHIRTKEGTDTPLRPLIISNHTGSLSLKTYVLFCLSALLIVSIFAILPFLASDWFAITIMFASAICISFISAGISLRKPKWSFQSFGASNGLTALLALLIVFWKRKSWVSEITDFSNWFLGIMMVANLVLMILGIISWKRVYGKPKMPLKDHSHSTE